MKRIDGHYLMHEIEHVLHFERGFLYTVRELITNPGKNVKNYLSENRSRLVKPIIFIILTSLFYSVVVGFFHLEDGYINYMDDNLQSTASAMFKWIQAHYGYANIIMGIFIALWMKLFFRKYDYNIFELLILLCFVVGMSMLILAIFGFIEGITHIKTLQIGGIVAVIYLTWAIGQFYDGKKIASYVKVFVAYLLGTLVVSLLVLITGGIIDNLLKH
ncbi:DUF3667 domain-containing protein [Pedobacter sp. Leaf176]|uniref:DUF3667 domain-containing protein n=1 Tax=Pedobacter sp. Leaf176 TaxID=1736286 RepID=UPI001E2A4B7C|nr:DUF3667 domain-containing protein [Pedobacter sp. Leaf176]